MRFMASHLKEGFTNLDEAADVIAMYTQRPKKENLSGLEKNLRLGEDGRYRWHWDPEFLAMKTGHGVHPGRLEDAVRNMDLPMLLVRGKQSDLVTQEIAQEFLEIAPHAQYVDIEKARHMVAGDRNDIFTSAVIEFLENI
jgi:pimeloyl-ACP methyl ester carboxylesterase